ncbi:MAG: hypothetical protein K9M54_10410 [Kiritimatiellales bacterium]|nr:hypothetical protein [Kiritimatiellales bacterium]
MDAWKNKLIGKALAEFAAPDGEAFDQEADYEAHYAIRTVWPNMVQFSPSGETVLNEGGLSLSVKPSGKETVLHVEHVNMPEVPLTSELISAEIFCENNALLSPLRWNFSQRFINNPYDAEKMTGLAGEGCVKNGILWRKNRVPALRVEKAYTCDYSLFAALPIIHHQQLKNLRFDMLESLMALRPGQHLVYSGLLEVPFKNGKVAVHEYQQYGTGILPWHYWVNGEGLLVCVIRAHYLFIWLADLLK